jgi:hypothetical protein
MQFRPVFIAVSLFVAHACAQTVVKPIEPNGAARTPNAEKLYQELRGNFPAADAVAVKEMTIDREGGVFHFEQGNVYFYPAVNGKVTGAVFLGKGTFETQPKAASEKRSLALLTKSGAMAQDLTSVVMRFTDGTADEIRKASVGAVEADKHATSDAENLEKGFRGVLHENLDLRLLEDVAGGGQGGFFLASFHMGSAIGGKNVLFIVDPEGTFHAAPDQVELTTWSDTDLQPWVAYTMQHVDPKLAGAQLQVTDERLDVTFALSGAMKVTAETTAKMRRDGVRVVRLNLYRTLRVSGVFAEDGSPLDFVQEPKEYDPDFAVILPKTLKAGDSVRLRVEYAGKDVVRNDGNGTYYLMGGARDCWYPAGTSEMGDFANFHMTFHLPKQLQIVATGTAAPRQPEDGGMVKSVWETNSPIPVAGFNLGDFKTDGAKTPAGFGVDAYADVGLPTQYAGLAEADTLGGLSSAQALKGEISQGTVAIQIYSDYFGKLPYDHVALTEQSACTYGQSWPMLVYLPICGFWDKGVLHQVGLLDEDRTYWTEVTPHEVSHQWWGSLVGFSSYRDQWMSEGFANFSVSLFLKNTSPRLDDYHAFWKEQQKRLVEKNREGLRPVDVGPLTMGGRVSNSKSGEDVYQNLIYCKGAYVLHMMEEQFWSVTDQDAPFKKAMQLFVKDYSGKAATTEDWKASMEKSMPKAMDLRGDGKLDWFFDEFVYGTDLPHYTTSSDFKVGDDGMTVAHFKITQSNVGGNFVMRVPVYLQLDDGQTKRLFNAVMHGNTTIEQTVKLPNRLPKPAKAILVNYNADILTDS